MKRTNTLLAMLVFLSGSAFAQTTWTIDKNHSKIGFSVPHMAVSEVEGNFNEFEASVITKSDDFNGAEISFTAKTASIDTDNERRDNHLKSPDFFDAEKNPEITFKGNLVKEGAGYKLKGDFTMHGVTKPVVFDPAKISRTTSPGSVRKRIKNSGRRAGNLAGCCPTPAILQPRRYEEFDSEFGICRRLEGIEPPLFFANVAPISCPDGLFLGV